MSAGHDVSGGGEEPLEREIGGGDLLDKLAARGVIAHDTGALAAMMAREEAIGGVKAYALGRDQHLPGVYGPQDNVLANVIAPDLKPIEFPDMKMAWKDSNPAAPTRVEVALNLTDPNLPKPS